MANATHKPKLSPACRNRLENWKFTSAQSVSPRERSQERDLIKALSDTFGNAGGFHGLMADVVTAAVARLLDGAQDNSEPSERWRRYLENGEFARALAHADPNMSDRELRTLRALSAMFADDGQFDGSLGEVVQAASEKLLGGWPAEEGSQP
ncbi:hypothetical protein [Nocardia asiatica]|uniref:hypothetical protein n=1 Tax=Nocardia asiatica TaxID=209252 RepID=UPI0024554817|nr:hypothetical protein [Nocardia asiatica]